MRDLAEFRNWVVQRDGRFRDDRLRTYMAYDEHWPLVIRSDQEVAGFALVRKSKPATFLVGEFFIKSEFRRLGIGSAAVAEILAMFTGDWEISFQNENTGAASFWRRTTTSLGYQVTEIELPVMGQPELPHDVWLSFTRTYC